MKILVATPNCAITGVSVCAGPQCLDVLVNTRDRWVFFHRQGGSMMVDEDPVTGLVPVHQHFLIDMDSANETGLTLVAENRNEALSLRWPCFALQDKDQIHFQFRPYVDLPQIAHWRAQEAGK